jgi:hypothetical protein
MPSGVETILAVLDLYGSQEFIGFPGELLEIAFSSGIVDRCHPDVLGIGVHTLNMVRRGFQFQNANRASTAPPIRPLGSGPRSQ